MAAVGHMEASEAATEKPSRPGRLMSRSMPSGQSPDTEASAASPLGTASTGSNPRAASSSPALRRKGSLSSTIKIRQTI